MSVAMIAFMWFLSQESNSVKKENTAFYFICEFLFSIFFNDVLLSISVVSGSEEILSALFFSLWWREFCLVPELVWAGELRVCDQSTVNSPEPPPRWPWLPASRCILGSCGCRPALWQPGLCPPPPQDNPPHPQCPAPTWYPPPHASIITISSLPKLPCAATRSPGMQCWAWKSWL